MSIDYSGFAFPKTKIKEKSNIELKRTEIRQIKTDVFYVKIIKKRKILK